MMQANATIKAARRKMYRTFTPQAWQWEPRRFGQMPNPRPHRRAGATGRLPWGMHRA